MLRLLCGGSQLGCNLGVALSLTVLQILTHLRQTGTGGDQLTDDDVLLQTGQRVNLALDGGFGQNAGGSWKDAADRKLSVARLDLVIPSRI